MFSAVGLELDGDHLDLSFRDPGSWTLVGPEMPIPSQWICLGDSDGGPGVQLGASPAPPEDVWLDRHYHGSDQFRLVVSGEYLLLKERMVAGRFAFQESGRAYTEGVGAAPDQLWMISVQGDWRGARSTMVRKDGNVTLTDLADHQLDRWVDSPDDPYWDQIPGRSKGVVGVKTTLQANAAGYVWGSFDDLDKWNVVADGVRATAGAFGRPELGPMILTVNADAGRVVFPAATAATEVLLVVVRGSCRIGSDDYEVGHMRVQAAAAPMDAVESGPDGLDAVIMVSDRRALPQFKNVDDTSTAIDALFAEVLA